MPALLFDLDGTMLETDPLHAAVFSELFAEHGRKIDERFYTANLHGRQNAEIFGEFFPGADAEAMAHVKEARFRERLGAAAAPMPGLLPLLALAETERWPVAVVSNAPTQNARAMLAAIGLDGRIGTIVLGDDCPRGKPDPYPYAEAMRRLGVDPSDAVAFEDSRAGLTSARAAGAYAVGVASSLSEADLIASGAHLVIRDFTDPALEFALTKRP